ncbi:MAG: NADH-quinone oxidoreductase subunit J [Pseudomonadota bacterium]
MEIAFYTAAAVAILATLGVITGKNPVHALLCLVVSLLAVAMIFFALGAPFAAMLEMIVYAGAILVLFVFVVMMLNLGEETIRQEKQWLALSAWWYPAVLSAALLAQLLIVMPQGIAPVGETTIPAKEVGITLFGPYVLIVELVSMLLLAAMVAAWHLGRHDHKEP